MPGKRLIICCDGTWQDSDGGTFEVPTNVTRLSRSIEPVAQDGTPQIVYYQSGVGTEFGMLNRLIGGATGQGLAEHVREGYGFLANNYYPGDSVVLLGFSRGAFTARSIAGLVNRIGILTRKGMDQFFEIYKDYREFKLLDKKYAEELAKRDNGTLVHKNSSYVTAIACFDTVGSLGIPSIGLLRWRDFNRKFQFHDTGLNLGKVGYAFHALALDENRGPFTPTMWEIPPKAQHDLEAQERPTNLRQCWFPGVHTNIGGGYDDQEISDITLAWMVEMLQTVAGAVEFCKSYLDLIVKNEDDHSSGEWAEGKIYDSATGLFRLVAGKYRTPGEYTPKVPGSSFGECIHSSVRVRQQRLNTDPKKVGWNCKPLQGWEVIKDEATGGWKWIKRGKNGVIERELTEEPLGKMEKKIAGRRVIEKYFGKEAWDLAPDEVAAKLLLQSPTGAPSVEPSNSGKKNPDVAVVVVDGGVSGSGSGV